MKQAYDAIVRDTGSRWLSCGLLATGFVGATLLSIAVLFQLPAKYPGDGGELLLIFYAPFCGLLGTILCPIGFFVGRRRGKARAWAGAALAIILAGALPFLIFWQLF